MYAYEFRLHIVYKIARSVKFFVVNLLKFSLTQQANFQQSSKLPNGCIPFYMYHKILEKCSPYELGLNHIFIKGPFSVQFYFVGILFIIFDLEIAFLFPLGIVYFDFKYMQSQQPIHTRCTVPCTYVCVTYVVCS